jgi:hypothetical protein
MLTMIPSRAALGRHAFGQSVVQALLIRHLPGHREPVAGLSFFRTRLAASEKTSSIAGGQCRVDRAAHDAYRVAARDCGLSITNPTLYIGRSS